MAVLLHHKYLFVVLPSLWLNRLYLINLKRLKQNLGFAPISERLRSAPGRPWPASRALCLSFDGKLWTGLYICNIRGTGQHHLRVQLSLSYLISLQSQAHVTKLWWTLCTKVGFQTFKACCAAPFVLDMFVIWLFVSKREALITDFQYTDTTVKTH